MFADPYSILGYAGLAIVGLTFLALTLQPAVDALQKRVPPVADPDEHATQPGAANLPLRDWKPGESWTRAGVPSAATVKRWSHDA